MSPSAESLMTFSIALDCMPTESINENIISNNGLIDIKIRTITIIDVISLFPSSITKSETETPNNETNNDDSADENENNQNDILEKPLEDLIAP